MKKYLKVIVCILSIIICLSNYIYIVDARDFGTDDTYTPSFTPDKLTGKGGKTDQIEKVGSGILSVVSIIGSAVSIIAIIALGIKYMLGSIEEKAEYKKTLIPYLVGAICVFGATTIPSIVYEMFNK